VDQQTPEPSKLPEAAPAGTLATRIWDVAKKLATITERFLALEKEDARNRAQLLELSRTVLELTKEVHEMTGQMRGIEKRLEDKDKLVEATIKLRVMEEVEKLRAEFRRD
jgi:hypothetical protein